MTSAASPRWATGAGLLLAAAAALWWLGSTRLALDQGADTRRAAAGALNGLWLARGLAVALLAPRCGAWAGWRAGALQSLLLLAPAWPVVVLTASASTASGLHVVAIEVLLALLGLLLAAAAAALAHNWPRALRMGAVDTALGVALAAALWASSAAWTLPLP